MKNMVKFLGIIALAAIIGFAFAACDTGGGPAGGPQTYQPVNNAVTGVTLNRTTTTILMGETEQFYAIVAPANATNRNVTWSSSDTAVATVSACGLVFAVSTGQATITATTVNGNFSASAAVTVSPVAVAVTGVTVAPTSFNLDVDGTFTLTETIIPSNATNQSVIWSSDNTAIAIVSASGTVTAIAPGSATITVTTVDGDFTAASSVTVNPILVTNVSVKPATSLVVGGSETLFAEIEPSNACNQGVSWSSSNNSVATVSASGVVTATGVGTATITVTTDCGGLTAVSTVTVRAYDISVTGVSLPAATTAIIVGDTYTFNAAITPSDATNQNLTWSSNNTSVATVAAGGVVTGVSVGTAVITVTTVDGGFTATSNITVNPVLVTGVSLNRSTTSLDVGNTETLIATVMPVNATNPGVTWSSNNTAAATVSQSGLVTAVGPGTATITVTTADGGFQATCTVTVVSRVTGVSLNVSTANIPVGATQTLTATVAPANATNPSVTWSSNNTAVAAVSAAGVVTAVSAGTATITVTTVDGGFAASCVVTVPQPTVTSVTVSPSTAAVNRGGTQTFTATVTGANNPPLTVNWTVEGGGAGTSINASGVLTVAAGETATSLTIRATSTFNSAVSGTAAITVSLLDMVRINPGSVGPNHGTGATITITQGFYIGRHPVTQHQWQEVMTGNPNGISATPSAHRAGGSRALQVAGVNTANFPVESVSWFDALVFANRLSIQRGRTPVYSIGGSTNPDTWGQAPTGSWQANFAAWNAVIIVSGDGYRLPTSAQWEFAARAGTTTDFHNGVNLVSESITAPLVAPIAWIAYNSGGWPNGRTHHVGTRLPNPWGLYDMHGNVWEWCWDDLLGALRMFRGGSWGNHAFSAMSSNWDNGNFPCEGWSSLGLRLVRP